MEANVVRKLTWRIMNCPQIAQIKKPAHKSGKKKGDFYHEGHEEHEEFVNRDSLRVLRVLRGKKLFSKLFALLSQLTQRSA